MNLKEAVYSRQKFKLPPWKYFISKNDLLGSWVLDKRNVTYLNWEIERPNEAIYNSNNNPLYPGAIFTITKWLTHTDYSWVGAKLEILEVIGNKIKFKDLTSIFNGKSSGKSYYRPGIEFDIIKFI